MTTFKSIRFHAALATLAIVFASFSIVCSAQTRARPAIETFFQSAAFSGAEMSPDGRFVAFRVATKGKRATLGVLDLETMQPKGVAAIDGTDIGQFHWVNDQRLVFTVTDLRVAERNRDFMPGLYAVERDGTSFRRLVETNPRFVKNSDQPNILPWNTFLVAPSGTMSAIL